jgi:hypothetical protein
MSIYGQALEHSAVPTTPSFVGRPLRTTRVACWRPGLECRAVHVSAAAAADGAAMNAETKGVWDAAKLTYDLDAASTCADPFPARRDQYCNQRITHFVDPLSLARVAVSSSACYPNRMDRGAAPATHEDSKLQHVECGSALRV